MKTTGSFHSHLLVTLYLLLCLSWLLCLPWLLCLSWLVRISPLYTGSLAYAGSLDMEMNATPNPVGSGARAMGAGGAFISVADDATAASWNPAGLLQLTKPEISVVGSWFSGRIDYQASPEKGIIEDFSPDVGHINYLSMVIPFVLFRRNMVFSLNYQHLYEFSKDDYYTLSKTDEESTTDISQKAHKCQRGSLSTISPALAFQCTPSLFLGLTANFWPNSIIGNGWENLNIINGEGIDRGRESKIHEEFYERYDFSGFNMHLGFLYKSGYHLLWGEKRQFRIGGVIKTPFEADIRHEQKEIVYREYPQNPVMNNYVGPPSFLENLILKMPLSYGLGFSFDFSDSFSLALDVYRTHWEQYLIWDSSKEKYSPINRKSEEDAHITPTTQIRFGAEYLIQNPKQIIPLRMGLFYDPEPASDRPDDFYGASFGTGISVDELFSIDCVYQFRFGKRQDAESIGGEDISAKIRQHYFYGSIIFYLF